MIRPVARSGPNTDSLHSACMNIKTPTRTNETMKPSEDDQRISLLTALGVYHNYTIVSY